MDQAEQLRKMVKQQERPKNVARVITVTSGKGGVGKTSVAVNLAIQLSRLGKRVVIFDADFGLANIEVMLGIRPLYNLADLMFRGKELNDIIVDGVENVKFISSGSGIQDLVRITKDQLVYLTHKLRELDDLVDIIIVDTSAGISDSVIDFVAASTEVILIATPEPTSITDAYALLKILNRNTAFSSEHTSVKLLANRITSVLEGNEVKEKLCVVSNKFLNIDLGYIGAVPNDPNVSKSIILQKPISILNPTSSASRAYEELAEKICLDYESVPKNKKGMANIITRFLKTKYKKR